MKVSNDLLGYKNLKIVQQTDLFCFSLDSVLLANYPNNLTDSLNILDIGTGNAPIPMILSTKTKSKINAIELQSKLFELAKESIQTNKLENQINLIHDDVKNLKEYFDYEYFDLILSNPPYFKVGDKSKINEVCEKAYARHEIKLNLDALLQIVFKFLKNNGRFEMVHRVDRLPEILEKMHKYKIEAKRLMIVFPKKESKANFFLVEGVKNSKPGLRELKYIIAHEQDGSYTEEIKKFFE